MEVSGHGLANGADLCYFLDEVGRARAISDSHVQSHSHDTRPSNPNRKLGAEGFALVRGKQTGWKRTTASLTPATFSPPDCKQLMQNKSTTNTASNLDAHEVLDLLTWAYASPSGLIYSITESSRALARRDSFATSSWMGGKQEDKRWQAWYQMGIDNHGADEMKKGCELSVHTCKPDSLSDQNSYCSTKGSCGSVEGEYESGQMRRDCRGRGRSLRPHSPRSNPD